MGVYFQARHDAYNLIRQPAREVVIDYVSGLLAPPLSYQQHLDVV